MAVSTGTALLISAGAGLLGTFLGKSDPPDPPKPPKPPDPNEVAKKKADAADKAKIAAIGAYGHEDTTKTSPLGAITPQDNKGYKTLLGG